MKLRRKKPKILTSTYSQKHRHVRYGWHIIFSNNSEFRQFAGITWYPFITIQQIKCEKAWGKSIQKHTVHMYYEKVFNLAVILKIQSAKFHSLYNFTQFVV
jgi:hypothetical protein